MFRSIWIYRLVRWGLSSLFIWAGGMKLADPAAFVVVVSDFGLVPEWSVMAIAVALPTLEIIAALGLIFDIRGSLTAIAGLLMLFMAILSFAIWLGLDIDCGCFGPEDPESRAYTGLHSALYRDMVMAGGIFFLYWYRFKNGAHGLHL
jgi:uncharacterized membrane protein YphA (DoxX/SURF4 family)